MPHILIFFLLYPLLGLADKDGVQEYSIDRIKWQKAVSSQMQFSIENKFGNINIKKAFDDNFIIYAVNQNHHSRKVKAQFKVTQSHQNYKISLDIENKAPILLERYDLTLIVPKDIKLSLVMNSGHLKAKKINNPLMIRSQSTQIDVSTQSSFDIFTQTGNININLLNDAVAQKSKIQSYSGTIKLSYYSSEPFFNITSGTVVVSNSAKLLNSKKLKQRQQHYNDPKAKININIMNDTGNVILIDKNKQ